MAGHLTGYEKKKLQAIPFFGTLKIFSSTFMNLTKKKKKEKKNPEKWRVL